MTYDPRETEFRMQPNSVYENGKVKLLPMSTLEAQDALTDIVMHEIMHCRTAAEAREIERNLKLMAEHTDMETAGYMGQVQATIRRLEEENPR
ncbi:hypothetical protein KY338_00240 [Candidatus Woesearchaeota archaeon]|nr:hypothetical protein [Candidatus Woesearchaeota archaeon]MBW3005249.1 hypothetical protein [Candidatus Woesearchaeota archaeon]